MKFCVAWTALFAVASAATAQTPEAAVMTPIVEGEAVGVAPVPVPVPTIPALTPVRIEIQSEISSKTAKIGEMFAIRLASPIVIDGKVIVPEGITGQGEVIHAAKARAAGKAGELILAARYLDWNGTRIALRTLRYGPETGESRVTEAVAVGAIVATPLTLLIAGGEKIVPAGLSATAKVAQAVPYPADISGNDNP